MDGADAPRLDARGGPAKARLRRATGSLDRGGGLAGHARLAHVAPHRPAASRPNRGATADERSALVHSSGQTVGLDAGAWCAYGNPADLPPDQRREDALSLSLDSAPLEDRIEIFGAPAVALRVASDRPTAFVVARLCDVAPDGASTLITRGVLNLCHRGGHDHPQALEPGRAVDITVHAEERRLRAARRSPPAPGDLHQLLAVAVAVARAGDADDLRRRRELADRPGARAADRQDGELPEFGAPETAPPLPVIRLRQRRPLQTVSADDVTGIVDYRMSRDFAGAQRMPSGLEYHDHDPVTFTIRADDPLSARVRCERRIEILRGDWRTRIELRSQMTADATDYLVSTTIDAYEGDTRVHTRTFTASIPRNHT